MAHDPSPPPGSSAPLCSDHIEPSARRPRGHDRRAADPCRLAAACLPTMLPAGQPHLITLGVAIPARLCHRPTALSLLSSAGPRRRAEHLAAPLLHHGSPARHPTRRPVPHGRRRERSTGRGEALARHPQPAPVAVSSIGRPLSTPLRLMCIATMATTPLATTPWSPRFETRPPSSGATQPADGTAAAAPNAPVSRETENAGSGSPLSTPARAGRRSARSTSSAGASWRSTGIPPSVRIRANTWARRSSLHSENWVPNPEVIVAKSIGPHAAPTAVARDIPGVWFTALLTEQTIVDAFGCAGSGHFAIGGGEDRHW